MQGFLIKRFMVGSLIGIGFFLYGLVIACANDKAEDKTQTEQQALKDRVMGDANAPVTLIEFASITCSHCADFYQNILPQLHEKYIKSGKLRVIFREVAYDPRAAAAFMLARCLPEERYFPMIQILFEKQREWAFVEDSKTPLLRIAKLAGFTEQSFEACLKNQQLLDDLRTAAKQATENFGVNATPTFFINGKKYEGEMSMERFSEIIDGIVQP